MSDVERGVVVTGVSSGIGWATTKLLVERGFRVFGSVRREEDAERCSKDFGSSFTPLLFDVRDTDAIRDAAEQVRKELNGHTLYSLVNNSGTTDVFSAMAGSIDDYKNLLDVNFLGNVRVCHAFIPLLGADRTLVGEPGRIIQMSSFLGKMGLPLCSGYAASKHALEGFSECLRRELMLYSIDVIILGPGSVDTPVWGKARILSDRRREKSTDFDGIIDTAWNMFSIKSERDSPETIAQGVLRALTSRAPAVRYALVWGYFANWLLPMWLPARVVDKLIAVKYGYKPLPRLKKEE